jgi:hypothetical protein
MTNSKRQPYGFGSFVKKLTRPVKKVAKKVLKSPLGKAALIGGGLYGLGGLKSLGGSGIFSGGQGLSRFRNLGNIFSKGNLLSQLVRKEGGKGSLSLGKLGLAGLLGAGVAMPFMGGDDEEEIIEEGWENTPASIANITAMARARDPSLNFLPQNAYTQSGFYAADGGLAKLANGGVAEAQAEQMLKMQYQKYRNQGGTMSYQQFKMTVLKQAQGQGPMAQGQPRMAQPQMAAKGGIMDLGGMEKDYRQEGGFVPLGKEEKADDVPARLSKNEFVFTADAVKAAGGGDIDAGAEVMQNMMDNLEEGGEISEESQGAQGMYNQQQMLQSRMA